MKRSFIALVLLVTLSVQAQEVSTLYFLENAPMRHLINPSFQPISDGYVNFTPLGYTSISGGNNNLVLSDLIYRAPDGNMVTALHPEYGRRDKLLNQLRKTITTRQDITLDWFSFGFRLKEKGYITIQAMGKIDSKQYLPTSAMPFFLNGAKMSPSSTNNIDLRTLGMDAQIYTEIGGGYSHKINDVWTVGGKFKFLMGTAYIGTHFNKLGVNSSTQTTQIQGEGNVLLAAPINMTAFPQHLNYDVFDDFDYSQLLWLLPEEEIQEAMNHFFKFAQPSGYGAAIDLGFTATPLKQLQVSVGLNDLGFIYWHNARNYKAAIDTTFNGVGPFDFGDYIYDGEFIEDSLASAIGHQMEAYGRAFHLSDPSSGFCRMITTKLNIGIDGRFFDNRLSVGLLSKTMLYQGRLSEEITLGVAGKPFNWLNAALSYSLFDNGKLSNIGAGLSIIPYDGVNITLAADYIPFKYTQINDKAILGTNSKNFNIALGFSIVWGTNPQKDHPQRDKKARKSTPKQDEQEEQ